MNKHLIENLSPLRDMINRQTEEFLKQGGEIKKIDKTSPDKRFNPLQFPQYR